MSDRKITFGIDADLDRRDRSVHPTNPPCILIAVESDPQVNGDLWQYHHRDAIEFILSSKTELLLYVKNTEYNRSPSEINRTEFAEAVWELMIAPYNFTFEEIQEAWRQCNAK